MTLGAALSLEGHYLYALSGNTGDIDASEVQLNGALTPLLGVSGLPSGSNGLEEGRMTARSIPGIIKRTLSVPST